MSLQIGQEAPDFELYDYERNLVRLSDFYGSQNVILVFYPFCFAKACEEEFQALTKNRHIIESQEIKLLGISCDSPFSQKKWAQENEISFPLLSDFWPHARVAKEFDILNETAGCSEAATFFIDKRSMIVDLFISEDLNIPRDLQQYLSSIKSFHLGS